MTNAPAEIHRLPETMRQLSAIALKIFTRHTNEDHLCLWSNHDENPL